MVDQGVPIEELKKFISVEAERSASAADGASASLTAGERPSARGTGRGLLPSIEEFLQRKHQEIDEEERRNALCEVPATSRTAVPEPRKRGDGFGKFRDAFSSTEEFLRRKHEEVEEEERRRSRPSPAESVAGVAASNVGIFGRPLSTGARMVGREGDEELGAARGPAGEEPAVPAITPPQPREPHLRGSAMGKFRGMLSSTEEFLRRKHEEIEEEERRWR